MIVRPVLHDAPELVRDGLTGLVRGVALGTCQYLALRRVLAAPAVWIAATTAGLFWWSLASDALGLSAVGGVISASALIACLQAPLLRTWRWVPLSLVAAVAGFFALEQVAKSSIPSRQLMLLAFTLVQSALGAVFLHSLLPGAAARRAPAPQR